MDNRQRDLLLVACREAYRCLRDRNRPQVRVEGRLVHSDAELASALRHFAKHLFALQTERNSLLHEIEPLWEAQISGALDRLLDTVEQLQVAEVGGWRAHTAAALHESDLHVLRALSCVPEKDTRVA
jgi:hypothetical protein